jgi:hypothetical protein
VPFGTKKAFHPVTLNAGIPASELVGTPFQLLSSRFARRKKLAKN